MKQEIRIIHYITLLMILLFKTVTSEALEFEVPSEWQCSMTPFARSINNFGANLTKFLHKGNVFISPFSIYNGLAMIYIGTRDKTAQQIEDALQLGKDGLDKPSLNQAFRSYLTDIKYRASKHIFLMTTGIFVQKYCILDQIFVNDAQESYQGFVQEEDFEYDPQTATNNINKFISNRTDNKIAQLLTQRLSHSTLLFVASVTYFRGTWRYPVAARDTTTRPFFKLDGTTREVTYMMYFKGRLRFHEDNMYRFLELPYDGGDLSMLIALPLYRKRAPKLQMTSDVLCSIIGSLSYKEIYLVMIPKFTLSHSEELPKSLIAMGIQDLFRREADITGRKADGGLKLSTMIHKAYIDVNENGTTPSAANQQSQTDTPFMSNFFVEHPFAFYIIDTKNGLILFSGLVFDIV